MATGLPLHPRARSSCCGDGGFTLVELITTIVLAGVLMAVALPHFLNTTLRAKAVGAKQGIHTMLLRAQAGLTSGEFPRHQLLAQSLDGMADGSTMAQASDGHFSYYGSLMGSDLYVVEAEAIGDQSLQGRGLVGCIDLNAGTITMQRDFDTPLEGCGIGGSGNGNGGGNGNANGQGWGVGGTPNP